MPLQGIAAAILTTTAAYGQATFTYFRFTPTKLRNDVTSSSVQIAEFQFLLGGSPVSTAGVVVTNPNSNTPAAETADKLIDGLNNTKWLDFHKNPVVFQFPASATIDGYRFTTANDANERDPVRWILEGSNDGVEWITLDQRTTDFATPTTRGTTIPDITLPGLPVPARSVWNGFASSTWDTVNTNWDEGNLVAWNNDSYSTAYFGAGTPTSISLSSTILARRLKFDAPDYTISGGTLILQGISRFDAQAPATISSTIGGAVGVVKTGPSSLHLSGDNTFSSSVAVWEGTLRLSGSQLYTGGTTVQGNGRIEFAASKSANGSFNVGNSFGRGTLVHTGSTNAVFAGTPTVGNHASGAGALIHQSGTTTYAADGTYLTIANATGAYGSFEMAGGTASTANNGGIRLGSNGLGVLFQTGGTLNCNRWFAFGGGNATGIATFLGGTTNIHASWRVILGDQAGGTGILNLGTLASGSGTINSLRTNTGDGGITVSGNATSNGILNLNSGTINLNSRIYRAAGTGSLYWNGGTLRAATNQVELLNNSLTNALVFHRGAVVDTSDKEATLSASLASGSGMGFYPTGGILAVPSGGGSGYLGSPVVTVTTSGTGTLTQAVARIQDGVVTQVEITNPGQGHQIGDTLSFAFTGGGADLPATPYDYVITANDLQEHSSGGLKKSGTGKLILSGAPTYTGTTEVLAGTLAVTGSLASSPVKVEAGATLTGPVNSQSNLEIFGALAPGATVGTTVTTQNVTFRPGSSIQFQLADWTGAAGTGHDLLDAGSIDLLATGENPLTVHIDTAGLVNFSETAKSFTLATADAPVNGLAGNVQIQTSDFAGLGNWSIGTSGNDLVLTYTPPAGGGFSNWIGSFPGLEDTTAGGDPDHDGVPNLLEYVLDRHPGEAQGSAALTTPVLDGDDYVFTFIRRAESKNDTVQNFEVSTNLASWTPTPIPATTEGAVTVTADQPSAGLETISVRVPAATAVDGKLFGRLQVAQP